MDIKVFSIWILVLVSSFSGILITSLWFTFFKNGEKELSEITPKKDYSLLLLAASLFMWSFYGITVLVSQQYENLFIKITFSSLNNLLLLLAAINFEYAPKRLINNKKKFKVFFIFFSIIVFILTLILNNNIKSKLLISLPDFLLSTITAILIGYLIVKTFFQNKLILLSIFSLLTIAQLLIVQEFIKIILDYRWESIFLIIGLYTRVLFVIVIILLAFNWALKNYYTIKEKMYRLNTKVSDLQVEKKTIEEKLDSAQQQQLIDKKTLEAKGAFIAIVSHEINTPLEIGSIGITAIRDNTIELKEKYENGTLTESSFNLFIEPTIDMANSAYKNMQEASRLIKSLKEISRDQMSGILREISLKDFLSELFNTLKPEWQKYDLQYSIISEPENIKVKTYPGALSQVFTNLITNSIRHGFDEFKNRKGGKIEIQIKRYSNQINFLYKDNGSGINNEDLHKIFDPYFSTKPGTGSGLGLYIIKKIVEDKKIFDGKIQCESSRGQGVKFYINIKTII